MEAPGRVEVADEGSVAMGVRKDRQAAGGHDHAERSCHRSGRSTRDRHLDSEHGIVKCGAGVLHRDVDVAEVIGGAHLSREEHGETPRHTEQRPAGEGEQRASTHSDHDDE
ncbi:MAG: hypothetical protein V7636_2858, partial [Actinomycetota bacterium]